MPTLRNTDCIFNCLLASPPNYSNSFKLCIKRLISFILPASQSNIIDDNEEDAVAD